MSDRKPRSPAPASRALEGGTPPGDMHRIVSLSDDELDAELREAGLRPEDADHLVKRTLRDASRLAAVSQRVPASGPGRPARGARGAKRVVVLAVVFFVAAILAGLLSTRRTAGFTGRTTPATGVAHGDTARTGP